VDYALIKTAKLLLENGADLDLEDSNGKTALQLASTEALREILLQHYKRFSDITTDDFDSSADL
jgi:ankyrin repeat protein